MELAGEIFELLWCGHTLLDDVPHHRAPARHIAKVDIAGKFSRLTSPRHQSLKDSRI
jgi:hypothetical protein